MSEDTFEPKIVGFLCNWCSYAGADLAGAMRLMQDTKGGDQPQPAGFDGISVELVDAAIAKKEEAKQEHYDKMMAELCGRETGYCLGRGGSMHIADVEKGNLGATGIVGGNIPVATGAGLAQKMQGTDRVVLCFFGDGASSTGNFHESLNMAGLWQLPVVYIVENNLYGMSVPISAAAAVPQPSLVSVCHTISPLSGLSAIMLRICTISLPSASIRDAAEPYILTGGGGSGLFQISFPSKS